MIRPTLLNGWDRDEMTTLLDQVNTADPDRFPWGMRMEDSHGWGPGLFLWFQSPAEMLEVVSLAAPTWALDPDDAGDRVRAQAIADRGLELAQGCANDLASLRDAMANLAEVLPDEVSWVGTPDDLVAGDGDIPQRMREEYWQHHDDDERSRVAAAIPDVERSGFLSFCATWGV